MSRYVINGIEYPSPSIILGELAKGENFYNWIGREALKTGKEDGYKISRDKSASIGSELHNLIECFVKMKIEERPGNIKYFLKDYDSQIKSMFMKFFHWQKENVKKFLESEKPIVHEKECCAGTFDFSYIDHSGRKIIVDLKTSGKIYDTHIMQVNFYKHARQSMCGNYKIMFNQCNAHWTKCFEYDIIKYDDCAILRISRESELEYKVVTDQYKLQAFLLVLSYYYTVKKRRLNNNRAKNRK
jgi:hypothetical protein